MGFTAWDIGTTAPCTCGGTHMCWGCGSLPDTLHLTDSLGSLTLAWDASYMGWLGLASRSYTVATSWTVCTPNYGTGSGCIWYGLPCGGQLSLGWCATTTGINLSSTCGTLSNNPDTSLICTAFPNLCSLSLSSGFLSVASPTVVCSPFSLSGTIPATYGSYHFPNPGSYTITE